MVTLPEEVVGMVLRNFIREKRHLLNARLVCRSWNKEALIQLQKSSFKVNLGAIKIKKFIKFARATHKRNPEEKQQFVLPFYLTFHVRETVDVNKINLELEQISSSLKSLLKVVEPECIHTLDFNVSPTTVEQISQVIKILGMVSPTVKTVKLRAFKLGENISVDMVTTLFQTHEFIFPKLKKLSLISLQLWHHPNTQRLAQLSFCSHLIGKAGDFLEELTLSGLKINEIEISPKMLKQIKCICVKDFLFVDLIGRNLLTPSLSSLTTLQIQASDDLANDSQSNRFLESMFAVASSLEYLSIEFMRDSPLNLTHFPEFPSLRQLQIRFKWFTDLWNPIPDFVNPVVFPTLTSIDLHLEIFAVLNKPSNNATGQDQPMPMPNVKQVTLRLRSQTQVYRTFTFMALPLPTMTNSQNFQKYFENLTARFPNAHKLIIINESFDEKSFKPFFRGLKGSEGAKIIHELKILDFDDNYLGQVFEEALSTPRIILENVPRNPELEKMICEIFDQLLISGKIKTEENQRTIIQGMPNQDTLINHLISKS